MTNQRCAIFLDRDGVVNRRRVGDYVKRWEEFEFVPDVFDVLPSIGKAGFLAVLVTNQQGIAKGLMTEADLAGVHDAMQGELRRRSGHGFDAIYFCPHRDGEGCDCRKPQPGMLRQAASDLEIDLACSWMIGDSEGDVQAGRSAGCRTIRIAAAGTESEADFVVPNLTEAWKRVIN